MNASFRSPKPQNAGMRRTGPACWIVALSLLWPAWAAGQSRSQIDQTHPAEHSPFADLAAKYADSVCGIYEEDRPIALGTIVTADGAILTKASEIQDKKSLVCRLNDGRRFHPLVVAIDQDSDLALLKIDADGLLAISLESPPAAIDAGGFLISVGFDPDFLGCGIIETSPRTFASRDRQPNNRSYLGVQCHSVGDGELGLTVRQVTDNSPARRAGIRQGDVLKSIDGTPLQYVEQLVRQLGKRNKSDVVELVVVRDQLEITLKATLGASPATDPRDEWGGGPFSQRRFDFEIDLIPHDTVLRPTQCGGPVFDTEGRIVGINIARALRAASFALPIQNAAEFVRSHRRSNAAPNVEAP